MTPPATLPQPESTYRLLLDAAAAWPGGIATQWIPDPADHIRCLDWTNAELAGTVTRIANALTVLGVRRQDAVTLSSVNTSMLYAAAPVNPALSSERIAELVRRTGSRVLVAAGPELDPQLWQRLLEVARQAGMTAVLALRPDGARGDPPALGLTGDAPAAGASSRPGSRNSGAEEQDSRHLILSQDATEVIPAARSLTCCRLKRVMPRRSCLSASGRPISLRRCRAPVRERTRPSGGGQ